MDGLVAAPLRPVAAGFEPQSLRLETHDGVVALYRSWRELEQRSADGSVFQSADWCRAWIEAARAVGAVEAPRILTLWRGSRLVLLWPLAVRRLSVFRILHALAEPATQYGDLLIDPDEDRAALVEIAWRAVRSWRDIDVIELRRVPDGSSLANLRELAAHAVDSSQDRAPLVDFRMLDADRADRQRTSRTRNALRRHERLLAELGPVGFEILEEPQEQCAAINEAFALKRKWQQEKSVVSAGYAHRASETCLERLAREERLFVARLYVGEQTAALEIGALRQRRYWSLVQSYDLRFARHAPGRLLFWHLLGRCPEIGIDVFDFLAPASRHKLEWSNTDIGIRDYLVPASARGGVALSYLSIVKPRLRGIYRQLPSRLRGHLTWMLPGLS